MSEKKASKRKENPIDKDKVAENPHLLPYAHNVGSALIKPLDKGKIKGIAVQSMYEQTATQLDQIREQVNLLVKQAQSIHDRVQISEKIYLADYSFKPILGKIYHLYQKKDTRYVLSMVAPEEWGTNPPYTFLATVKMMADHTWEILNKTDDFLNLKVYSVLGFTLYVAKVAYSFFQIITSSFFDTR